jgi:membrane associated rhomboid family serine protease
VIPLRDERSPRGYPIVTRLLLAINLVLWLYVVFLSRSPGTLDAFYAKYAFDWSEFTSAIARRAWSLTTFVPLVSHMFLHGGWLHVLGNMLYLWIFGDNVEDALGSMTFLGFYLACGVIAAIAQGIFGSGPMVGASGAIAGVLGAYLLMFPTARIATLVFLGIFITVINMPAIIVIGLFIVVQVIEAVADLRIAAPAAQHIAYFAHVFGFLAGMLLSSLLRGRSATRRTKVGWG